MSRNGLKLWVHVGVGMALLAAMLGKTTRPASAATIIYVKARASGANNGTSWADAFTDLQTGLAAAASGDQVWVARGRYRPTFGTDRTASFHLKDGVAVYGGFLGNESQLSQRNPYANKSTLSGDIGVVDNSHDNSFHVVTSSLTTSTAILDGFTIKGGRADGDDPNCLACDQTDNEGAGLLNKNGAPTLNNLIFRDNWALFAGGGMLTQGNDPGSPSITNSFFIHNFAGSQGGGLFVFDSSPTLTKVIISTNNSYYGGGMEVDGSSNIILQDVTFAGNNAQQNGGGMWNGTGPGITLRNVTFNNNKANNAGGGLYNLAAPEEVTNATFNANTAGQYGGAIYNWQSSPDFGNITVAGNSAGLAGGGMFDANGSVPNIYNSIFWGNSNEVESQSTGPVLNDTIVKGGCPLAATCTDVIDADPVLGKLKQNGGPTETMALGAGSDAIDAGGLFGACTPADQRGMSRPQGPACDLGAYEVGVMQFPSVGAYDGQVLESGAGTGLGGTVNATNTIFSLGDSGGNQQFRGFLSFDTSPLPNNVTVVLGKVQILQSDLVGTNPFTTLGDLRIDLANPYFGSSLALTSGDFQTAPTVGGAGSFNATPNAGWYTGTIGKAGSSAISLNGTTQLRLRFTIPSDNNSTADHMTFYSGDTTIPSDVPYLLVYYNP